MNDMLQEICKALLQADVNVAQVKKMRESIKNNVDVEALAGGLNKRKMLEQAVCNELCSMLDPGKEPYQPKKKQQWELAVPEKLNVLLQKLMLSVQF